VVLSKLHDIIAPASVKLFLKEGIPIGDKRSLLQAVHEKTEISFQALERHPLNTFTAEGGCHGQGNAQHGAKRMEHTVCSACLTFKYWLFTARDERRQWAIYRDRSRTTRSIYQFLELLTLTLMWKSTMRDAE
jgi:hypothetical protein